MSLSHLEIAQVVDELQPLVGGAVQKIRVPTQRMVTVEVRVPGATHALLLSAEPNETRLHRTTGRAPAPANPLAFQGLLRAHLLPARLVDLRAAAGDRVVELRFETPRGARTLVAELTGRHGNLILLDEARRILGLAVPSKSERRSLRQGAVYEPPVQATGRAPAFTRFGEGGGEGFPISQAIEAHYQPLEVEREGREQRREIGRLIANAKRRASSALRKLTAEASRAQTAEELRRYGELLKPILRQIPRGATSAKATEYREDGVFEVEIPLRPELSPKENLDRYFKAYQRMLVARERIEGRRRELGALLERAEALEERLEGARAPGELEDLLRDARELSPRRAQGQRKAKEAPRPPYRIFRSGSGRTIWVGRGAKENDALTLRHAKGSDLWLHARGVPGAHVVIPLERGAEVDQETLLDAAALATHFSGLTSEAVAQVSHTQVRHIRKPKGSAPGAVVMTQEKTIAYRVEESRLRALLEGER